VLLLSCYLGGIVIVQPFFTKKNVVCSVHKKTPIQTTSSLASKIFKKNLSHACVSVFRTLAYFTLEVTPTQLVDLFSLTAKPTQASLCTCLC
jgi:hypothetical protein